MRVGQLNSRRCSSCSLPSQLGLTSMDDRVAMAVFERAPDLPREFSRRPLPESTVADDVVEHLSSRDVLERHVVVVRVDHHLRHAADVWVVEQ